MQCSRSWVPENASKQFTQQSLLLSQRAGNKLDCKHYCISCWCFWIQKLKCRLSKRMVGNSIRTILTRNIEHLLDRSLIWHCPTCHLLLESHDIAKVVVISSLALPLTSIDSLAAIETGHITASLAIHWHDMNNHINRKAESSANRYGNRNWAR